MSKPEQPQTGNYDPDDLGPPIDDSWVEVDENRPMDRRTQTTYHREPEPQPITIELLNPKQPFRYRERLDLVLRWMDNRPVVTTRAEYSQALSHYNAPLFSEQFKRDNELTFAMFSSQRLAVQKMRPDIDLDKKEFNWRLAETTELKFIIDHLPATEINRIKTAWQAGELVNFSLLHGPKWKISHFADGKTHQFNRPRPNKEDATGKFAGSNFVLFTKVQLEERGGELCVMENLMAEANVGTKQGHSKTQISSCVRKGKITVDRTLSGLISRHQAGDPELTDREYLFNQFKGLWDKVDNRKDQRWVRKAWIEFLREQVPQGYQIRPKSRPKLMMTKEGHVGISHTEEKKELNYVNILRINVAKNGYLGEIIMDLQHRSHMLRRWEKLEDIGENIYPFFKQAFDNGGSLRVAEDLFRVPTLQKMFLTKNRNGELSNLCYLLYCFANDPGRNYGADSQGQSLSNEIINYLRLINYGVDAHAENPQLDLSEKNIDYPKRLSLTESDWKHLQSKIKLMLRPNYFAPLPERASWQEEVAAGGPKHGLHHNLLHKENSKYLFRKTPHHPRMMREELTDAFDVQMPKHQLSDERAVLVDLFIDYCKTMANDGYWTTPYMVWRDTEPHRLGPKRDHLVTGRYLYNRARVLFRPTGTDQNFPRLAIQELYRSSMERLEQLNLTEAERHQIAHQLDYNRMIVVENTAWQTSGRMGEVFIHMALENNLPLLLNKPSGQWESKIIFENIDRKGRQRLITNLNGPDNKTLVIPDFMARITDKVTGEVEDWLIEVKTYIKFMSVKEITDIVEKYRDCLDHRKLLVVVNAPSKFVTAEAHRLLAEAGGKIVAGEQIASALKGLDKNRYPLPTGVAIDMIELYNRFIRHPSAFATKPNNCSLLRIYQEIATEKTPLFVNQLREEIDQLYN